MRSDDEKEKKKGTQLIGTSDGDSGVYVRPNPPRWQDVQAQTVFKEKKESTASTCSTNSVKSTQSKL